MYTIIVLKSICTLKIYKVFENCGIKIPTFKKKNDMHLSNVYNNCLKVICILKMQKWLSVVFSECIRCRSV